jgi:hypothetical protein
LTLRSAVYPTISLALGLALTLTGLALGGPALAAAGFVLWLLLDQLIRALLPVSIFPRAIEGALATSAAYRGWAAKLVGGLGFAKARTVQADVARLRKGVPLRTLSYGVRDGSQTLGYLLLQPSSDGQVTLGWRGRGKGQRVQPIGAGKVVIYQRRKQPNGIQARAGFVVSIGLGGDSYWLRTHDAEILRQLFQTEAAVARPAA